MTSRILYLTNQYLPYNTSGACVSTHTECKALLSRDMCVAVLAERKKLPLIGADLTNRIRSLLTLSRVGRDAILGYPVYRRANAELWIEDILDIERPGLLVAHPAGLLSYATETLSTCQRRGIPTIVNFRALQAFWRKSNKLDFEVIRNTSILTNSHYMAGELVRRMKLDQSPHVVFPIVEPERYEVESFRECVVFVNPVPMKGVDVVIRLAKSRPDVDFLFVEAWRQDRHQKKAVRDQTRSLPNIRWQAPVSDMRSVYRQARIVLAPTPRKEGYVVEAWGRVATEAHVSGIPVIATAGCGFEESVGPGGILVDSNAGLEAWQDALSRLWDNENEYRRICDAAKEYSKRDEIKPARLVDELCGFFEDSIQGRAQGDS